MNNSLTATEPTLLTIAQILSVSLSIFSEKLGSWPLVFAVTDEFPKGARVGHVVRLAQPAVFGERTLYDDIVLAHQEPEWAYFSTNDLALSIEEFAERHLRHPMTNLAAVCRQWLNDYKRRVIFGKLILPSGIAEAGTACSDSFAIRGVRVYDVNTDRFPFRFDVLFGGV